VVALVIVVIAAVAIHSVLSDDSKHTIEFSTQSIVLGETATATLTGLDDVDVDTIVWTSNDPNVVSAEGSGATCTLTAKSVGQATIAAAIDGEPAAVGTVRVVETAVGVVQITVTQESVTIRSGDTYTIQATVVMESDDMSPAKITWTSKDASIARVSDDGVITARDVGQTIIKGTAGEQSAEIVVTVVENPDATPANSTGSTGTAPDESEVADTTPTTDGDTTNDTGTDGNDNAAEVGTAPEDVGDTTDTGTDGTTDDAAAGDA
jgi:hypothetical protein